MAAPNPPADGSRRQVLALAWPIGVSMISLTLKQLVDNLMVGSLGTNALAAVGLGGIVAFNVFAFPIGVLRGQKSLVSQYQGAGDRQTALSFGAQAFYLALMFALAFVVLHFFAGNLIAPMTGQTELDDATRGLCAEYLSLRILWGVPYILSMSIAEYLRARGRTRLPMAADLIAHPLNAFFNYLLIFGHLGFPALGVAGAAIGTGLADCVSLLLLLRFTTPRKWSKVPWEAMRFNAKRLWRMTSVGASSGIQFTIEVGSFTIITFMIGYLGTVPLAAHQACIAILHVSWMPGMALGDGGGVLIGRYVGQKNWAAVARTFRSTLSMVMPLMLSMGLVFVFFGESMASLFLKNDDPEVQAAAVRLGGRVLIIAAIWQLFDVFQIVYRFSLRAAGDHRWVMWVGILSSWGLSVPLAWATVKMFNGDIVDVWSVWTVELVVSGWIFHRRWKSGIWKQKRLVRNEDAVQETD